MSADKEATVNINDIAVQARQIALKEIFSFGYENTTMDDMIILWSRDNSELFLFKSFIVSQTAPGLIFEVCCEKTTGDFIVKNFQTVEIKTVNNPPPIA